MTNTNEPEKPRVPKLPAGFWIEWEKAIAGQLAVVPLSEEEAAKQAELINPPLTPEQNLRRFTI